MPIGGFVITHAPGEREAAVAHLEGIDAIDVHGTDDDGNIVAVMDTETSVEMDDIVHALERNPLFLTVGLAYLHAEDEVEAMERGEIDPGSPFGSRRKKKDGA